MSKKENVSVLDEFKQRACGRTTLQKTETKVCCSLVISKHNDKHFRLSLSKRIDITDSLEQLWIMYI